MASCSNQEEQTPADDFVIDPQTQLIKFLQVGNTEGIIKLVDENPELQLDFQDRRGFHILHIASIAGNIDVLELLFAREPSIQEKINLPDWTGCTALHYTCNEGWDDCTQFLLERGAKVDLITEDRVCYIGGTTMPMYVPGGKTPLHLAAERGELGCVNLLLNYGAQMDVKDFDGNSPYDLALLHRSPDIAEILKPSPSHPHELPKEKIEEKRLSDYRLRSQRIGQKEKERKEQERKAILDKYEPLHPDILKLEDDIFTESFLKTLKLEKKEEMTSSIKQEFPGVYVFDMLKPEFCKKLIEESENYEKSGLPVRRPNSMNSYGLILDDIGFQGMIDEFIKKCITPFAKHLFPDYGGDSLDSHHAFIVRYKIGEDLDLATHTDDSEVTLNVCLGKSFEGGSLYFKGVKHTPSAYKENFEYNHKPGTAVLHVGNYIHGANKITSGERINLIIWCRSSKIRGNKKAKTLSRPPDIILPAEPGKHVGTVIFLHGLGDSGDGWLMQMRKLRMKHPELRFVIPTAPNMPVTTNKGAVGTAWHDIIQGLDLIDEEEFEGLERSKEIVFDTIEREVAQTGIPYEKIILAGFSQGAALALYATYQFPKKLGGSVAMSGYLPHYAKFSELLQKENSKTPSLLCHGMADEVVKPQKAQRAHDILKKAGVPVTLVLIQDQSHRSSDSEMKKVESFIVECVNPDEEL